MNIYYVITKCVLPWYNHTWWPGRKQQVTYHIWPDIFGTFLWAWLFLFFLPLFFIGHTVSTFGLIFFLLFFVGHKFSTFGLIFKKVFMGHTFSTFGLIVSNFSFLWAIHFPHLAWHFECFIFIGLHIPSKFGLIVFHFYFLWAINFEHPDIYWKYIFNSLTFFYTFQQPDIFYIYFQQPDIYFLYISFSCALHFQHLAWHFFNISFLSVFSTLFILHFISHCKMVAKLLPRKESTEDKLELSMTRVLITVLPFPLWCSTTIVPMNCFCRRGQVGNH